MEPPMSWTDIYHLCNGLRDDKLDVHVDGSIAVDALDLVARNNCRLVVVRLINCLLQYSTMYP
jgi:hypothetical protein